MSVLFTVPVFGAACTMLCEPVPASRAHHSHAGGAHATTAHAAAAHAAADDQAAAHHAHDANGGTDGASAHHHHAASPSTVSDTPRPSAEWNGHCCDQPTLTLAAIPVVRQELQMNPAVFQTVGIPVAGITVPMTTDLRHAAPLPPAPLGQSNLVLRI
jgi:hypothetical protein